MTRGCIHYAWAERRGDFYLVKTYNIARDEIERFWVASYEEFLEMAEGFKAAEERFKILKNAPEEFSKKQRKNSQE